MRLLIHDYAGHPFPISLSRQLAARGHAVTHAFASQLLTPRGDLQRREEDPSGLSFQAVPMSPDYRANKYSFLKRVGYEREYGHQLVRLADESKPDVILSGQTPSDPQLMLIRAAAKLCIPVVSWVQDFYSMAVDKLARKKFPVIGALAGTWYRHLDARCLRGSAGVVAITDDFVPILTDFGVSAERITVIPNWAPLAELPLRPRLNYWSAKHGLHDKFVFLYAGTLAMKHNPDLLRQLALRFKDDQKVRVIVVSEGPGADFLCARKSVDKLENLEVLSFQPFGSMPEVLASANVVVTLLEADAGVFSVPSKVLSYHAAGRPILGAMPEANLSTRIIKQQGSGICVNPHDVEGLMSAARILRHDSAGSAEMGRRARAYAEAAFDITKITEQFEKVFARVRNTQRAK